VVVVGSAGELVPSAGEVDDDATGAGELCGESVATVRNAPVAMAVTPPAISTSAATPAISQPRATERTLMSPWTLPACTTVLRIVPLALFSTLSEASGGTVIGGNPSHALWSR
jgi:hypothetical protein